MKRTPLKRKSPLRRVSKKQAKKLAEYNRLKAIFFVERPRCEFYYFDENGLQAGQCSIVTDDVHHMARRGKNLLVVSTWMPVCRRHHRWIEENGREARAMGYLK